VVSPVAKLENAIFLKLQSRLYHHKSTQRQLELKEKAQRQGSNSSNSQKASQRKHERTGKLNKDKNNDIKN
jgi:hypothetical protein